MTRVWRSWMLAGTLAMVGTLGAATSGARAQLNTYADVPFNQGSLFYRPSGARPPATTSARTVRPPAYANGPAPQGGTTYYYPTAGVYQYPQYQQPAAGAYYYYPQYPYRQRRGLFGLFR